MVVTNDPKLAERAAFLRDHAMDPRRRYYHPEVGFNYRMTNIQAAIGCAQLEQVEAILARRKVIASAYETGLAGIRGLTRPPAEPWAESVHWMYSVLVEPEYGTGRDAVIAGLRARGVDSRPFFVPLHRMPPYREDAPFPVSTSLGERGINLPSGTGLTLDEIATVCAALREMGPG
jgi:perosamine synthetase